MLGCPPPDREHGLFREMFRLVLRELEQLHVLFYRGDSAGEGGSGVFVLGDSFLPHLLERFPQEGGSSLLTATIVAAATSSA